MWEHWDEYGIGWGTSMLLFWVLLIAAIVMLSKFIWSSSTFSGRIREKGALDILRERYARGEIESEEFMQKKRDLRG
jgi:putative membrane protein